MNEQQLKEELRALIAETIEIDDFADDEDFINDIGADSMMMIEIVARLEKKYKISIAEQDLPRMKTFAQVFETVKDIMAQSGVSIG